jgi:hypothetical protein
VIFNYGEAVGTKDYRSLAHQHVIRLAFFVQLLCNKAMSWSEVSISLKQKRRQEEGTNSVCWVFYNKSGFTQKCMILLESWTPKILTIVNI